MAHPTSAELRNRLGWADIAKAGAIILVVVYHVGGTAVGLLTPGNTGATTAVWATINTYLLPTRMPLFFLISGVLAVSAVQRPWHALWRPRVADLLWPFVLWTLIYSVLHGFLYTPSDPLSGAAQSARTVLLGGNAYWFLTALVFFFCVTRLLRRFPVALLVASTALWLGTPWITESIRSHLDPVLSTTIGRWCTFMVWFMVGCFLRHLIERIVALPAAALPIAAILYAIIGVWVYRYGAPALPWVPALNILGLVTALTLSAQLARFGWLVRTSRYLSQRTLPIYLLHPVLLAALVLLVQFPTGMSFLPSDSRWLNIVLVPSLVTVLVLVSVKVYDATMRTPFAWLFRFPRASGDEHTRVTPRSAR